MAERYDLERERTAGRQEDRGRESGRDFGNERYGEPRREEFERERRFRGEYGEGRPDEYGRRREHFGENWGERENYWRPDWHREPERGDYSTRGDWGRQGSWGTYGNRPDFSREAEWRDYGRRGEPGWGSYPGRTANYGAGPGSYSGGMGSFSGGMGMYGERGRFTGRGPKNWQRSDDRIREDINERLTDHPDIDASEIEVQVKNGEVTLTGTVEERYTKRMAEDVAENVTGVREVHNQLRVQGQEAGVGRSNAALGSGSTGAKRT
jgi:hypothetical protein